MLVSEKTAAAAFGSFESGDFKTCLWGLSLR
jgi:hypothetical protein